MVDKLFILFIGLFAVIVAQTMNTINSLFSKKYYTEVLIFTLISQLVIGFLLIKYYGNGIKYYNFSILALFYYAFGVIISVMVQFFIFHKGFKLNEIVSIILIFSGILVYFGFQK